MKKNVVKIIQIVLVVILAVALASAVYVSIKRAVDNDPLPTMFGYAEASVTSGSMEDAISVGDMVIVKAQDNYSVGDIVCYRDYSNMTGATPTCITHRIIEITPDGYITKGDANDSADPYPVLKENIVGTVVKIIPGLGAVSAFLHSTSGIVIVVLILFLIIVLPLLIKKKEEFDYAAEEDERKRTVRARHSKSMNRLSVWIVVGVSAILMSTAGFTMAAYLESHSVSDTAKVAKFEVTMSDLTSSSLHIDCSDDSALSASTSFTVTGTTEVACQKTIVINTGTALPSNTTMVLSKDGVTLTPTVSGTVYTFTADAAPANSVFNDSYTLTITGSDLIRNDSTLSLTITAEAIQID